MTPELWGELRWVQHDITGNSDQPGRHGLRGIMQLTGRGIASSSPSQKRCALIVLGWPPGALQLATVFTPADIGHLVLVIATTAGDWVLDNLRADVVRWEELPYRWVARQQGASMQNWVSVEPHS